MGRDKSGAVVRRRDSFALSISGLAIFSVASVVISMIFHDPTMAIAGTGGLVLVAAGVGAWSSGRWVRRAVTDLRRAGSVSWPVYAQSDRDSRYRRGFLTADEFALAITLKTETVRLEWSDIQSVTLRPSAFFKSGRVLVAVPTRGALILEILASNAMVSFNDSTLLECINTLEEFRPRSPIQSQFKLN